MQACCDIYIDTEYGGLVAVAALVREVEICHRRPDPIYTNK